jgi:uncharacterized protein YndB with AHSA1/START domain
MPNIIHRIGTAKATVKQTYSAISKIDGLANWWTPKVSGESKVGGILQFRFSKGGPDFEVIALEPYKKIEWKCIQGPDEWIDTHIEFNISRESDETVLLFRHGGWRQEVEFMYHCSTQWGYFLIGLRKFLETGAGSPYGNKMEMISNWSK